MGRARLNRVVHFFVRRGAAILLAVIAVAVLTGCSTSSAERVRLLTNPTDDGTAVSAEPTPIPSAAPVIPGPSPSPGPEGEESYVESNPGAVPRGGETKLSAGGFDAGETITISALPRGRQKPVELSRGEADADGALNAISVRLPDTLKPGRYTLRAAGETSRSIAEARLYVRAPSPELEVDIAAVRQGGKVTVSAAGFDSGDMLALYVSGVSPKPLLETQADPGGNVEPTEAQVPILPGGDFTLVMRTKEGTRQATRIITVVERSPWVVLDPYALLPGQSLSYTGYDFVPGEDVKVTLDGKTTNPLGVIKVNDGGSFSQSTAYTPDAKAVGKHRLTLVGEKGKKAVVVEFEVLSRSPSFGLSAYAGPPGTKVRFEGKGFEPGETVRVLLGDGQHEVASFKASQDGAFANSGEITIPLDAQAGNVKITLRGDQSQAPVAQEFNLLALTPWAGLSVYAGDRGASIYVEGRGFAPGEDVGVYLGDAAQPLATAKADSNGQVTRIGPVALPDVGSAERVTFVLKGQRSGSKASVDFALTGSSTGQGDQQQGNPTPANP